VSAQRQLQTHLMIADRMAALGTLAAGMAHEINNPLAVVMMNLELVSSSIAAMVAEGQAAREALEELNDAGAAASRIRQIISEIALLGKRDDADLVLVDVQQVVKSAVRMMSPQINHRARLVTELERTPMVRGNIVRLGEALINLLVNAVQAIPEGEADGNEIRVTSGTNEAGDVLITVADTGCGIPHEVVNRLFMPFFTTKPVGSGKGLGLAVSYSIVASLGGSIVFDSSHGKGTRFIVTLPAAEKVETKAPRLTEAPRAASSRTGR
jgi:two-component system cell cycle sensor histidine kinase/response regulator CckA